MDKRCFPIYEIIEIAFLAAILFLQEQVLMILPNVQLTVLLIVIYSKCFDLKITSITVLIHVILDNIFMSSFNLIYFPFMLMGWLLIPLTLCTIFKNVKSPLGLAFLGIGYAFIYSWLFIIPHVFIMKVSFFAYLASDVVFEIVLASSSFLTIWWLYAPLSKLINKLKVRPLRKDNDYVS